MFARILAMIVFASVAGCSSTPMPLIPIEPPLTKLTMNEARKVALSSIRIKTGQGARTYVSTYFSQRRPMHGWVAGQEYPIATQIVAEELRSLGITVFDSSEGLLATGIKEKLDFLLSGTVQPIRLDIHDTYSGDYTEGHYRLSLKLLDARSGESVWEGESDGQGALMNDPTVIHDLAMGSNIVTSLSQNEDRAARLIIANAFRGMMRAHAAAMTRIFTSKLRQP